MIVIKIKKDNRANMINRAKEKIIRALSETIPPFDPETDEIKLGRYTHESDRIKLTYEILRNVRRSKTEDNLSPYKEIGLTMQVGRNS
jgi:hypothetical protein